MFKNLVGKLKNLVSKKPIEKPTEHPRQDLKPQEIVEVKAPVVIKKWKTSKQFRGIYSGTPMAWKDTDKFRGGRAHNRKLRKKNQKADVRVSA